MIFDAPKLPLSDGHAWRMVNYPLQDVFTRYHCLKHNIGGFDPCALCKLERMQEEADALDMAEEEAEPPARDAYHRYHCAEHRASGWSPPCAPGEPSCPDCKAEAAEGVELAVAAGIVPTGWVCPRCSLVNAPHINRCACKPAG